LPVTTTQTQSERKPVTPPSSSGAPADSPAGGTGRAIQTRPEFKSKMSIMDRMEAFVSKLSTRNNFWHRVCSFIWLPYAFHSGIKMKRIDAQTFTAILPFKRFNRNWYNAMAGASLLANSEIAGGMYLFAKVGKDYTVVCKRLEYKFLRPCFGPAVYKVVPLQDIDAMIAQGGEFNVDVRLNIHQGLAVPGKEREKRVGRCEATFHVTPKLHHKDKKARGEETEIGRAHV